MGGHNSSPAVSASTNPGGDFDYKMHLMRQTEMQAEVDENKDEGFSSTYRQKGCKEVWTKGCKTIKDETKFCTDIYTMFLDGVENFADKDLQGWRKYNDEGELEMKYTYATFPEVRKMVDQIACALSKAGVEKNTNVGIFAKNRPEWFQAMVANSCIGARTVALYDTLGEEALEHILKQAEISVLFTEKHKLKTLKKILGSINHFVKVVVVFDHQEIYGNKFEEVGDDEQKEWGTNDEFNVELTGLSEFLKKGDGVEIKDIRAEIGADDLCNIMYTSGTTGLPKGVMLSHIGVLCAVAAAKERIGDKLPAGGRHYSYLPLAHIFELMVELACVNMGLAIAFTQGNIKKLAEDLGLVQPTLFIGVPRIYGKFYEKFWAGVKAGSFLKKKFAKNAFKAGSIYIRDNERSGFYDKIVWKGVAAKMGLNQVKISITGAAPMPGYLMEFVKLVTNAPMVQGYGLTETTASGGISALTDTTVGHNGTPPIACEIRLADVAEMNYTSADKETVDEKEYNCPRGEIQIRGPVIFKGYYKMPEKTEEVLTKDGWFCTGDIGRINPNGTLSIIDRKKNIFKLSQGEYIAVEKVENTYAKSATINQIWVYGNSFKPKIVAVVVPDALGVVANVLKDKFDCAATPATPEWISAFEKCCESEDVRKEIKEWVFTDMKKNTGKLKGFEKIATIHVELKLDQLLQGFNVDNNCLTPSFKLKRPQLKARYIKELKQLYTDLNLAPQDGEEW